MKNSLFTTAAAVLMVGLLAITVTAPAYARGRYGSHRVGGYTSHGKGSHYVGGYVRHTPIRHYIHR